MPPPERQDAFARLNAMLRQWGLEGMSDDVWTWLEDGEPEAAIVNNIRQHPVYERRFPAMEAMRQADLPVPSEAEYMNLEQSYRRVLSNIPEIDDAQLTDPAIYTNFFVGDTSPEELSQRADAWWLVTRAPDTTARFRALFEQTIGRDMNEEELFGFLTGVDESLIDDWPEREQTDATAARDDLQRQLAREAVGTDDQIDMRELRSRLKEAQRREKAAFRGGGGRLAEEALTTRQFT